MATSSSTATIDNLWQCDRVAAILHVSKCRLGRFNSRYTVEKQSVYAGSWFLPTKFLLSPLQLFDCKIKYACCGHYWCTWKRCCSTEATLHPLWARRRTTKDGGSTAQQQRLARCQHCHTLKLCIHHIPNNSIAVNCSTVYDEYGCKLSGTVGTFF